MASSTSLSQPPYQHQSGGAGNNTNSAIASAVQHELSTINSVAFGVLSDEQIQRMSVLEVTDPTLYDNNQNPKLNGVADPRMGVTERGRRCKTCEQDYIMCPGHMGHISLALPFFNFQFDKMIISICKCICVKCSRLLINKDHPVVKNILLSTEGKNAERFDKISKLIASNNKPKKPFRCGITEEDKKTGNASLLDNGGCGATQPDVYHNEVRDNLIIMEWKQIDSKSAASDSNPAQNIVQQQSAAFIYNLFKRISEEDAYVMGFAREYCLPHYLVFRSLPVIPPCSRPSVRQGNGNRSEDDITIKYLEIIKFNNELKDVLENIKRREQDPETETNAEADTKSIQEKTTNLMFHIITLIDNEDKNVSMPAQTRNGRPIKGINERLKGKEGLFRGNLMGKRVDFSARSVISPDANLDIGELGVPRAIAMNLTFPETVNQYNIDKMYQLVKNGNLVYPGAKSVEQKKTGQLRVLLESNVDDIVLEYGDVVNRHLVDEDYVLFNRQPTLHRMSMMGHKIRVMPGQTFRLNTDVCEPYNAD